MDAKTPVLLANKLSVTLPRDDLNFPRVEARFCRWLLQSRDRAESDIVPLTQELISEMLGVRRTSVTEVAIVLQDAGVISYTRGIIRILGLARLKELSCECYETLRDATLQ